MNIPLSDLLAAADEFEANGSALADSLRLLAGELWVRRLFFVHHVELNPDRFIPETEVHARTHIPNSSSSNIHRVSQFAVTR